MNYNNLAKLLQNIPRLPPNSFCYDCINNTNYNKNNNHHKTATNARCFILVKHLYCGLKHDSIIIDLGRISIFKDCQVSFQIYII